MEILEKPPIRKGIFILKWLLILALSVGGILLLLHSRNEIRRYLSVQGKAVTLEAVVTEVVEDSDSETGTDYDLYVSYDINGKKYKDRYDTLGNKKKANAMLGKTVSITINPEKPTEQLKEIQSGSDALLILAGGFLMFSIFCIDLRGRKWRVEVNGWYPEIVFQDIRGKALRGAAYWVGCLCAAGVWLTMCLKWPALNRILFVLLGAAAMVAGLIILVCWVLRLRRIENRQYILGRDRLVNKTIDSDSDGTTYYLHYTNGQKEWKRSVTPKKYAASRVGTVIETVRLKEKGRPYLCFSRSDNEGF